MYSLFFKNGQKILVIFEHMPKTKILANRNSFLFSRQLKEVSNNKNCNRIAFSNRAPTVEGPWGMGVPWPDVLYQSPQAGLRRGGKDPNTRNPAPPPGDTGPGLPCRPWQQC